MDKVKRTTWSKGKKTVEFIDAPKPLNTQPVKDEKKAKKEK